jgi:ubiquinone/menaquinone biosynthesis C-methylase UbiE
MSTLDQQELELNYKKENSYWWFVGRRRLVIGMAERYLNKQKNCKLLDVGCGTGIVLKDLIRFGEPTGVDISEEALSFSRTRGIKNLVQADIVKLPFEDGTFDAVTILGVLYSKWVSNEVAVFRELYRVMKRGGIIVSDEGAFKILTSRHNKRVGSIRRYRKYEIKKMMEEAGFKIVKISYWNMFLFPLFLAAKILDVFVPATERGVSNMEFPLPGLVNKLFIQILRFESRLIKYFNLPFGTSVMTVGVK